jgi:hypothetical protein
MAYKMTEQLAGMGARHRVVVQRECTPAEGEQWRAGYREGYRVARGDIRWNAGLRHAEPGLCGQGSGDHHRAGRDRKSVV